MQAQKKADPTEVESAVRFAVLKTPVAARLEQAVQH